jgi:hypothetical protein
MRCFRRSLSALIEAFGKPVLIKNLYATLRLEPLIKYVPESLFIIVVRDELANGHSLLEARKRVLGSYEHWWSMPPPDVDELLTYPPSRQVIDQIRSIQRLIQTQIQTGNLTHDRYLEITYEDFCSDVHAHLQRVADFLVVNNADVPFRDGHVPRSFPVRSEVRIDRDLYEGMVEYVDRTR